MNLIRTLATSLIALASLASSAIAQDVYVHGYYRSNGTFVQPHYRTHADSTPLNNYSTYPNINPYTGTLGTKTYSSYPCTPSYSYTPAPTIQPLYPSGYDLQMMRAIRDANINLDRALYGR
jgi:hypothetical protein